MTLPTSSQTMLADLETVALRALERAGKEADHCEALASDGENLEVGVRAGAVELVKQSHSRGLSMRVVVDGRVATSGTTDLAPDAVDRFVDELLGMAAISEEDPLAAPPDPSELASGDELPDLDLFDPTMHAVVADRARDLALEGERVAFAHDKRITSSEGSGCSRGVGHSVLATSGGFVGRSAGTSAHIVVHVVADDEGGKKRNGFHWTSGRYFDELDEPASVGVEAATRALRCLGATKMDTGVYPVVFHREAAGRILGLLADCILGDTVYQERSYLASRLGSKVASDLVTVVDDPLIVRGPGSRGFDGEGRLARKNVVVDAGKLESFLLDTYSARKLRSTPTGSGGGGGGVPHSTTSNFVLQPGEAEPEALLAGIERGLYVTSMMGFGFDPVTGDFSRGASGFLIEGGELAGPISEVTISRNVDELFQAIDMLGNDPDLRSSTRAPSLRVESMTVSGR